MKPALPSKVCLRKTTRFKCNVRQSAQAGLLVFVVAALFLLAHNGLSAQESVIQLQADRINSLESDEGAAWFFKLHDDQSAEELAESDLSDWESADVPANLVGNSVPAGTESVWYRTTFELPADFPERVVLRLGEISDRDRVYLNGELIGETGDWDAERPQAYDRVRFYPVPTDVLRRGETNTILIHVQAYFESELGIYRDDVSIGSDRIMYRDFYLDNGIETIFIVVYGTVGVYFLLFYLARKREKQYFVFSLFLFALMSYSALHTQYKYDLGFELFWPKRIQYTFLFSLFPLFYYFVRFFFYQDRAPSRLEKYAHRFFDFGVILVPIGCVITLYATDDVRIWNHVTNTYMQPIGWFLYVLGTLYIMVRRLFAGDREARYMFISCVLLLVSIILDILSGRAWIPLPEISTYVFNFFVASMALILANQFVRLFHVTEKLNEDLAEFNQASRRFVPFQFLRILDRGSITDVRLGDQVQREMSILFSDIQSFTTLSEQMTPRENFEFINSYLKRMAPVVQMHGGFIDKFIGDAIMALFPEHGGVSAAVEMQRVRRDWNAKRAKHNYEPVTIGVGVHTGSLMIGTIGTDERMDGTVISDDVNLAARVEGLTRIYRVGIAISDAARATLAPDHPHVLRFLDRVRVKGKREATEIYEVLDAIDEAERDEKLKTRERFEEGIQLYSRAQFSDAIRVFGEVCHMAPGDHVARLYLKRSEHYASKGAPVDWDGTSILSTK